MFDMFGTEKSRFGIAIQAFRFLGAVNSYVVSSLVLGSDVMSSDKDAGIEETKGPVGAWNATGSPTLNHTKSLSSSLTLGKSLRHEITADLAEPKVLSPHKTRPGNPPRRIEVERKKREK